MKKWFNEEWEFFITVKNDNYKKCRLGLENGDVFRCNYEVSCDFYLILIHFHMKN